MFRETKDIKGGVMDNIINMIPDIAVICIFIISICQAYKRGITLLLFDLVCLIIMLVNFSNQNLMILIPAIIIIAREIMVSGLREFLASVNVGIPVTKLSKWKTAIQMVAITALLLAGNGSEYVYNEIMDIVEAEDYVRINLEGIIETIGEIMLCVSAIMTVVTGYIYFKVGFKNF